jgi:hypothetical protein
MLGSAMDAGEKRKRLPSARANVRNARCDME